MEPDADYSIDLLRSAETGEYQTCHGITTDDINRVTHRLRNQAKKLNLEIHIETNKQSGKVSFICTRKE